jgi:cephalosporin-C deacetylase-like acetyl esterase
MEPVKKDSVILDGKPFVLEGGTLSSPGFLRCLVTVDYEGRKYRGLATAGFDPSAIKPSVGLPADFTTFWESAKKELSRVPLNARMTLIPERCTENVNVYLVNLQNIGNSRLYGIISIPRKEGKYPAILEVPGAGVRAYSPDVNLAERGVITFVIGIHGVPVTMDPGVYFDLGGGALREYWTFNMDNKDRYYYKRVYLGCVRANDFITSLPQFDGTNLAVMGGSQGGALSIITASLDPRVRYLAAQYPALCDVTGYLSGRAGGWPHFFDKNNVMYHNIKEKLETIQYYDVVNFAREIKVPGFYTWGFNDETCPPTSMYAAYNMINAPKTLHLALETGHWTFPEQNIKMHNWLVENLTKK